MKKRTYDQIVAQIKALWPNKIEQRMGTGGLVGEALALDKPVEDVAFDTGISPALLRSMHRTHLFWGDKRIQGCLVWSHYESVALANDRTRQRALVKGGHALCIQTTRDATGTTKSHRNKVATVESAIHHAIVTLSTMQTPLTETQVSGIRAKLDALSDILDDRAPVPVTIAPPVPATPASGYKISPVRAWAQAHGFPVADRGKIAAYVVQAYRVAHA